MFRAMFSPIIGSTWMYLQYLGVFTQVAAGWCPEWVETHPWHQPAATWVNTPRYCKNSQVLLMMGENRSKQVELTWNNKLIYRVSIKSFPYYKHLLQENYLEYKYIYIYIFFKMWHNPRSFFLQHISTLRHVPLCIPRSFLVMLVIRERLYAHPVRSASCWLFSSV